MCSPRPTIEDELAEDYSPPVIAETTSNLRHMSVGEAVMELDLNSPMSSCSAMLDTVD